ncbi:MAG: hypothetical protein DPW18_20040 [Chloroflexi bacterium]|nr:hypothetical protein [Chloroflexota bacterium]
MDLKHLTLAPGASAGEITKENAYKVDAFSSFVYVVPFVVRLFPVNYGSAKKGLAARQDL